MADRGDAKRIGRVIDAVIDQVRQARDREAAQPTTHETSGSRMVEQPAQRGRDLLLDVTGGLRIARFQICGNAFEIVRRPRGEA